MSVYHLLCAGHVTLDRYGEKFHPGGCVTYASLTFSALGGKAYVVSRAGEDFPKDFFAPPLEVKIVADSTTTIFENIYFPDGHRRQRLFSCAGKVEAELVPPDWRNPRVLFLAPVIGELDSEEWLSTCRAELVAVGLQGFLREKKGNDVLPKIFDVNADWLDGVDLVFLSDDDCLTQPDLPQKLRQRVKKVVLTHQRRGCTIYAGPSQLSIGVYPVEEVDPTGAGDTFAAGFLFAICQGGSDKEAARLGAACASIIIEGTATSQAWRIASEARKRAVLVGD